MSHFKKCILIDPSFFLSTYLETSFEIWFSKSDSESNKSSSDSDDAITLKYINFMKNHENNKIDRIMKCYKNIFNKNIKIGSGMSWS